MKDCQVNELNEYIETPLIKNTCKFEIKFDTNEEDCLDCFNLLNPEYYMNKNKGMLLLVDEVDDKVYRVNLDEYKIKSIEVTIKNSYLYFKYDGMLFVVYTTPEKYYTFHKNSIPSRVQLFDNSLLDINEIIIHIFSLYSFNEEILKKRFEVDDPKNAYLSYPIYNDVIFRRDKREDDTHSMSMSLPSKSFDYTSSPMPSSSLKYLEEKEKEKVRNAKQSFRILECQNVPHVGEFILYSNKSIRILYRDRCLLRMNNNTNIVNMILPNAKQIEVSIEEGYYSYPQYIRPAIEFQTWVSRTPEEREKITKMEYEREKMVNDTIEENRLFLLKNSKEKKITGEMLSSMSKKELKGYFNKTQKEIKNYMDYLERK